MAYLLDTCLLSEVWKPAPNEGVVDWLSASVEEELYMSVLSLGELRRAIERLADGKKKQRLAKDHAALRSRFGARILGVSAVIAERWGTVSAEATRAGKHVHVIDGLLAATALVRGLTVVTRNVSDFAGAAVPVLDPWR